MRAALFHGPGRPFTVERVDDPKPARDEVLVKICRCGICGSDVSMTAQNPSPYPLGHFGHEFAGEVVEIGRDVTDIKVGDRVACLPCIGCGQCENCRRGDNTLFCTALTGLSKGFSEYVAMPPRALVRLPQSLSLADGALVEPIACGVHALRLAGMRGGERILVLGAGTMALAIIYWARVLGAAKIVAVSRSAHRRDVVLAMGADAVLSFEEDDPKAIAEALGGPADITVECVGKPGMLNSAIELVRSGGTVISMGMCMHHEPILPAVCTFRELRLLFPIGYTPGEFAETAKAFDAGRVRLEQMVSDVIALEELPATIEQMRAGAKTLKVHVDPWRGIHG